MYYTIVVAKYNENIWWTKGMKNVVIYDKSDIPIPGSISLLNIGREAETFIRYIVDNYDNLPDHVVFLQGNPYPHITLGDETFEQQIINSFSDVAKPLLTHYHTDPIITSDIIRNHYDAYSIYFGLKVQESYQDLFEGECPDVFPYACGAQYSVPKSAILCRSKQFYMKIHKMLLAYTDASVNSPDYVYNPNAMSAWTIERLWPCIFDSSIKVKG
jgi:hypothetical protein